MLKNYSFGFAKRPRQAGLLIAVLTVGVLGTYLLISSQAATPYASIIANQGTLNGATLQADSSASNGHYVQFGSASTGNGITYGTPLHPFSASAPVNVPIPANPKTSASNGRITGLVGDIYAFGNPTYIAAPTDPKSSVSCSEPWGTCPFAGHQIPIPANAVPASGSDASMEIIDPVTNLAYEFWQFRGSSGSYSTSWGDVVNITSNVISSPGNGSATGSNIAAIAGEVRIADIQSGHIDHAITMAIGTTCSSFVFPATKSDGSGSGSSCLPEGVRVQLDPSINLAGISGITPFELMVGKALQTYGAYIKDTAGSGTSGAIGFENPADGNPDVYKQMGISDYYNFPHLPNAWQVLNNWNGL
jgi:hypothetical protein